MTRAGQYDTQATFEYKTTSIDDDNGDEFVTWTPLATNGGNAVRFWVRALDVLQGRSESVTMNVPLSRGRVTIRMRYRSDITSAMRCTLHRGVDTIYQIISEPAMIGRQEELEIVLEKYSS